MMTQAERQRIKQELRKWLHQEIDNLDLAELKALQEAVRGDTMIP